MRTRAWDPKSCDSRIFFRQRNYSHADYYVNYVKTLIFANLRSRISRKYFKLQQFTFNVQYEHIIQCRRRYFPSYRRINLSKFPTYFSRPEKSSGYEFPMTTCRHFWRESELYHAFCHIEDKSDQKSQEIKLK